MKLTFAAETLALLEGTEYGVYFAYIRNQLVECMNIKIQWYTDNKSIIDALQSMKN